MEKRQRTEKNEENIRREYEKIRRGRVKGKREKKGMKYESPRTER